MTEEKIIRAPEFYLRIQGHDLAKRSKFATTATRTKKTEKKKKRNGSRHASGSVRGIRYLAATRRPPDLNSEEPTVLRRDSGGEEGEEKD